MEKTNSLPSIPTKIDVVVVKAAIRHSNFYPGSISPNSPSKPTSTSTPTVGTPTRSPKTHNFQRSGLISHRGDVRGAPITISRHELARTGAKNKHVQKKESHEVRES